MIATESRWRFVYKAKCCWRLIVEVATLGLALDLMSAEVISKKEVIKSPVLRISSLRTELELIYKGI